MSASYVRAKFREWAEQCSAAEAVPFHDTINIQVKPVDPIWFTCVFQAEKHTGTICDKAYVEYGYVELMFMAPAGTGDVKVIEAVEKILPQMMAKRDDTGRLVLENYDPIVEETAGSADSSYRVYATISYSYSQV